MDKDDQSIMFCPKCGTKLPEGSLFCGRCGVSLQEFLDDGVDDSKFCIDANTSVYYTDKINANPAPQQQNVLSDQLIGLSEDVSYKILRILYMAQTAINQFQEKNDDAYVAENKWHKNLLRIVAVLVISLIVSAGITIAFAVGKTHQHDLLLKLGVPSLVCAAIAIVISVVSLIQTPELYRKCRETVSDKRMEPVYSTAITEIHDAMRPLLKVLPKSCRTSSFLIAVGKYVHFMPTAGEAMLKADMGHSFSADSEHEAMSLDIDVDALESHIRKVIDDTNSQAMRSAPKMSVIVRSVAPVCIALLSAFLATTICVMTVNSINVVEAANEARKTAAQAQTKSQDNKDEENKSQDNKDAEEQSQDKKDIEEQPQNKSQQSESPVTPNYDQFLDLYKTVYEGDSMTPIEGTYCRKDGSCVVIAGNSIAPSAGESPLPAADDGTPVAYNLHTGNMGGAGYPSVLVPLYLCASDVDDGARCQMMNDGRTQVEFDYVMPGTDIEEYCSHFQVDSVDYSNLPAGDKPYLWVSGINLKSMGWQQTDLLSDDSVFYKQ